MNEETVGFEERRRFLKKNQFKSANRKLSSSNVYVKEFPSYVFMIYYIIEDRFELSAGERFASENKRTKKHIAKLVEKQEMKMYRAGLLKGQTQKSDK